MKALIDMHPYYTTLALLHTFGGCIFLVLGHVPIYISHEMKSRKKKLSFPLTVMFLTGELIGAGVLALPYTVVTAGYYSFVLIVVIGLLSCYGGVKLGRCWQIIIERWPEYDRHVQDPYPIIGQLSFGKYAREFVRWNVHIMLFGSNVVLLLLGSQLVQKLVTAHSFSYCYWILILGVCLIPPSWLGTPKDFCTVVFMNGGSATFPTIQNDMKDKSKFSLSIGLASIVIVGTYLTVGAFSFTVLSKDVETNILVFLPEHWPIKLAQNLDGKEYFFVPL
ncbi:Amino acid transporter AVT1D [Nymphon striatum]|nr:Amino acid transporter AVT1D [Nymphon striatum]